MFGRKKLLERIEELAAHCRNQGNTIDSLKKLNESLKDDLEKMYGVANCEHEFQLVCACVLRNTASFETGGIFSSTKTENFSKTYYHQCNGEPGRELYSIYACRCRLCGAVKPATCFDVAAMSEYEWHESEGPSPFGGMKYMVCSHVLSKNPNKNPNRNKIDQLVEGLNEYDTP